MADMCSCIYLLHGQRQSVPCCQASGGLGGESFCGPLAMSQSVARQGLFMVPNVRCG